NALAPVHDARLMNYLMASRIRVGLPLNFGPRPEFRRRVVSKRFIHVHPGKPAAKTHVRKDTDCQSRRNCLSGDPDVPEARDTDGGGLFAGGCGGAACAPGG